MLQWGCSSPASAALLEQAEDTPAKVGGEDLLLPHSFPWELNSTRSNFPLRNLYFESARQIRAPAASGHQAMAHPCPLFSPRNTLTRFVHVLLLTTLPVRGVQPSLSRPSQSEQQRCGFDRVSLVGGRVTADLKSSNPYKALGLLPSLRKR